MKDTPSDCEWFRVEVSDGHGQVVAIEPEMLAGRTIGDVEEATIARAIKHLTGFLGNRSAPAASGDERPVNGDGVTIDPPIFKHGDICVVPYSDYMRALNAYLKLNSAALCARSEWMPIESAPKDGTEFLAVTDYGKRCTMKFNGREIVRTVTCRRCDGMGLGGLTSWSPLIPAPPK